MQRNRVWLTKWEKIQDLKILRWPIVRVPQISWNFDSLSKIVHILRKILFWFFLVNSFPSKNGSILNNFSARYTTERWSMHMGLMKVFPNVARIWL
jgi:hypothetical protein